MANVRFIQHNYLLLVCNYSDIMEGVSTILFHFSAPYVLLPGGVFFGIAEGFLYTPCLMYCTYFGRKLAIIKSSNVREEITKFVGYFWAIFLVNEVLAFCRQNITSHLDFLCTAMLCRSALYHCQNFWPIECWSSSLDNMVRIQSASYQRLSESLWYETAFLGYCGGYASTEQQHY